MNKFLYNKQRRILKVLGGSKIKVVKRMNHFVHVWKMFWKRIFLNPKYWFKRTLKTPKYMIENDIEWLKERLCSCDNNDLKDFERSES